MRLLKILVATLFLFLTYDTVTYLKTGGKVENHPLVHVKPNKVADDELPGKTPDATAGLVFCCVATAVSAVVVGFYFLLRAPRTKKATERAQKCFQSREPESPFNEGDGPAARMAVDDGIEILKLADDDLPLEILPPPKPETRDASSQMTLEIEPNREVEKPKPAKEQQPISIQVKCECPLMSFEDRLRCVEKSLNEAVESAKSWSLKMEKAELDILELQKKICNISTEQRKIDSGGSSVMAVGDGIPLYRSDNYEAIRNLNNLIAETNRQFDNDDFFSGVGTRTESEVGSGSGRAVDAPQKELFSEAAADATRSGKTMNARESAISREMDDVVSGMESRVRTRTPMSGGPTLSSQPSIQSSTYRDNKSTLPHGSHTSRYSSVSSRYLMSRTTLSPPPQSRPRSGGRFNVVSVRRPENMSQLHHQHQHTSRPRNFKP